MTKSRTVKLKINNIEVYISTDYKRDNLNNLFDAATQLFAGLVGLTEKSEEKIKKKKEKDIPEMMK